MLLTLVKELPLNKSTINVTGEGRMRKKQMVKVGTGAGLDWCQGQLSLGGR